ncbi:MAG: PaaI family thioesterase [Gammaproteobacteria bacterium]
MSEQKLRSDANRCFVCGPANPIGLCLQFRLDDEVCRAEFVPGPDHCGFDGVTHGGVLYAALDDVMANWLFLQGIRAYTARCEVRYRETVAIGTPLLLEGRLDSRKRRLATMSARALDPDNNKVVAEASASFMIVDDIKEDEQ